MKHMLKHTLASIILVLSFAVCVAAETAPQMPPPLSESAINAVNDILEAGAARRDGDYATALRIYRKLANQGDAFGQNTLGTMYEKGEGVPQSYAEAAKWYRLAVNQGDAVAQYNLGSMNAEGRGLPKNNAEALNLYQLAASQGYARAQFNLGVMYAEGLEIPKDYVRAYVWFSLSAAQGYEDAVKNRDLVIQSMSRRQIAQAQKLVSERWDHVPPPRGDRWGPGVRVPAIIISPYAKRRFVDHTTYETTSILKFIETRWNLAPLGSRDAAANTLLNAFDFSQTP